MLDNFGKTVLAIFSISTAAGLAFALYKYDPNEPPRYNSPVDIPAWTESVDITGVHKGGCTIEFNSKTYQINGSVDLGDGLTATREQYRCLVSDTKTECIWGVGIANFQYCRQENPAWTQYKLAHP